MSLYVIGDLHLCFSDPSKTMSIIAGWQDYQELIEKHWLELISPDDTVDLAGDISWECHSSRHYRLPLYRGLGKIVLKGNHDYWWTTKRKWKISSKQRG